MYVFFYCFLIVFIFFACGVFDEIKTKKKYNLNCFCREVKKGSCEWVTGCSGSLFIASKNKWCLEDKCKKCNYRLGKYNKENPLAFYKETGKA